MIDSPTQQPPSHVALLVEDEPLIMMEASDILESGGFKVIEAWNADMALKLLEAKGPVKLLMTDVHMPGSINGFELAREVSRRWPATHVVVCSGHYRPQENDLPAGARFVPKPFSSKLILETIEELEAA